MDDAQGSNGPADRQRVVSWLADALGLGLLEAVSCLILSVSTLMPTTWKPTSYGAHRQRDAPVALTHDDVPAIRASSLTLGRRASRCGGLAPGPARLDAPSRRPRGRRQMRS